MLKRIFAIVSEKEFYAFQQKARNEGLDMGQALAALVHVYASTGIELKKHKDIYEKLKAEEFVDRKPEINL